MLFLFSVDGGFDVFPGRLVATEGFGMTDEQVTAVDGVFVHAVDQIDFRLVVEVDHDVSAPDAIEGFFERKRLVHQIETTNDGLFFHAIVHGPIVSLFFEVFFENGRGNTLHTTLFVHGFFGLQKRLFGNIGTKQSDVPFIVFHSEVLEHGNDDRVRLFPAGSRGAPDSQIAVAELVVPLDGLGQNRAGEEIEMLRLPEEESVVRRDLIRQFADQLVGLIGDQLVVILLEITQIPLTKNLLQSADDEIFLFIGKRDSKAFVDQIANGNELLMGDRHHVAAGRECVRVAHKIESDTRNKGKSHRRRPAQNPSTVMRIKISFR